MQQTSILPNQDFFFTPPLNVIPKYEKEIKKENELLGKKIKNDADLISWLSGKEINQKTSEEKVVPSELNFKVKKKLRNKLIKNAKKCELFFVQHYPDKDCINIKCSYCLKNKFNQNELLRFVNFEDFIYYLKYIFYLSDKVISYSTSNFKLNKKESDNLFSKFESKEENWKFNKEKIICKLCFFTLINKPNFVQNMKQIFLEGKNEMGIDESDNIFIEINTEKKSNEKSNKKEYKKDIPNNNKVNIYNSNNINIDNRKIIINNNYNNYINVEEIGCYDSFYNLQQKVKNPSENFNSEDTILYYKQLFFINHNEIIECCSYLYKELRGLLYYLPNIKMQNNAMKNKDLNNMIIQGKNKILYVLDEIYKKINISNNCIIVYLIGNTINNNIFTTLNRLISLNEFNSSIIEKIAYILLHAFNLYTTN